MCIFCDKKGFFEYMTLLESDISSALEIIRNDPNTATLCDSKNKRDEMKINIYGLLLYTTKSCLDISYCDENDTNFHSTRLFISKHLGNITKLLHEFVNIKMTKEVEYLQNCTWVKNIYGVIQVMRKELSIHT